MNQDNSNCRLYPFEESDVATIKIMDYVDWFINEDHPQYQLIQLPPIQRGAVWRAGQIERFWDSFLRGFPIGSFVLSPRKENDLARSTESRNQVPSARQGWFLLDGQQRTRALLLGFRPDTHGARLWIDLAPPPLFENSEQNDRVFIFRLLTNAQPWGMERSDPDKKLHEKTKEWPRRKIQSGNFYYDYQLEIDVNKGNEDSLNFNSWPLRSGFAVPFDKLIELIKLCNWQTDFESDDGWNKVKKLRPLEQADFNRREKIDDQDIEKKAKNHFKEYLLNAIKSVLVGHEKRKPVVATLQQLDLSNDPLHLDNDPFKIYQISQNVSKDLNEGKLQTGIEVLFRRLNSGGTVLAGEEMMFSLLKAKWDESYTLVEAIVNDKDVGYILPPSTIVLLAARLALSKCNKSDGSSYSDVVRPSVHEFRRWIGDSTFKAENGKSFTEIMQALLEKDLSGKSRFHNYLYNLCELALYHPTTNGLGLPRKLLLSINPVILYPVIYWLDQQQNKGDFDNSRLPILRYLIYSLFGTVDNAKASLYAVEQLKVSVKNVYPDQEIYSKWLAPGEDRNKKIRDPVALPIPKPSHFKTPFANPADGFLRSWNSLFDENNSSNRIHEFRRRFWAEGPYWRNRILLLWFQRQNLDSWFPGYNPMRDDGADTPYDYDHILAKAHLIKPSHSPNIGQNVNKTQQNEFNARRWLYLNSIGNFRVWPSKANRSDSDDSPDKKLYLNSNPTPEELSKLSLLHKSDFMTASAIDLADENLWRSAGGKPFDWPQDRREAWQTAVENRTCWLYKKLFEELGFSEWAKVIDGNC